VTDVTLSEIVSRLGGVLKGDGSTRVHRIGTLALAKKGEITFLTHPRYQAQLALSKASAVILSPEMADQCPVASIATPQPYLYFARLAQWLEPPRLIPSGIHPSATVESAIPATVSVGPSVWIGPGCVIGEGVRLMANCSIGPGAMIGADSFLHPGVTIYPGCQVGQRALIHSGAIVGSDGFGFAKSEDGSWLKIPQMGGVRIGADVEIGAGTTIDRGAIEDTVIEEGVKLDNQIQVGHNVHIGAHTAIAGCVGIAGSARIGRRCTVGGGAVVLGHIEISDDVHISAGTLIAKSISRPGTYAGTIPALERQAWLKNFAHLRHLDDMADKIRALERRLSQLEKKP
jgi:UDP-3-O-[3-hydroxymyristoyl] glucosamine N-acyltransferase